MGVARAQPLTTRGADVAAAAGGGHTGSDSLTEPLALRGRSPGQIPLLAALQPNILRPHVRDRLRLLLIRVDDRDAARAALAGIARDSGLMKSAAQHFDEVTEHRATNAGGTAFVGIGLSRSGYDELGVPDDQRPADPAFGAGMRARGDLLLDPDPRTWEYPHRIDGMILVGSHTEQLTQERVERVCAALDGVTVFAEETGATLREPDGTAIEHFGYLDGRSQPLFVREDAEREREQTDGTSVWDPLVPLRRVLVPDPGAASGDCFGSYLVYRKLEQNVRAFDAVERLVAQLLALSGDDEERAGAMLVGRFEDGTPVAIGSAGHSPIPVPNNFTYADDPGGTKCPHFAHIRVMNDRGRGPGERTVIARRGQTYGSRPDLGTSGAAPPTTGVGLLFMAVVADIETQFEGLQRRANGSAADAGDPVISQGPGGGAALHFPLTWGEDATRPCADGLARAVTMKGGEYLFLPSITFLQGLHSAKRPTPRRGARARR
jgi:deferrochelatase/peroxidase EfeB